MTVVLLGVLFWAANRLLALIPLSEPFRTIVYVLMVLITVVVVLWIFITILGIAGIHVPLFGSIK